MAGVPSRQELESMKRADLQRLCKDHGLKANLKSEALIDLLLDAPSHESAVAPPPSPRARASSLRIISRGSSSRSRLQSSGSMIVHSDIEDEGEQSDAQAAPAPAPAGPATRTRKAKETQLRLGVGRPMAAGGSGARSITKSVSVGKGRRGRGSRSVKPVEDTIPEEEPQLPPAARTPPIAGPSDLTRQSTQTTMTARLPSPPPAEYLRTQDAIQALIREQILPLQQALQTLQTEIQHRNATHTHEVNALKATITDITAELQQFRRQSETVELLKNTVERLQADLDQMRRNGSLEPAREPMNLSTPVSIPTSSPPHPGDLNLAAEPSSSRHVPAQSEPHRRSRPPRSSPAFEYPPPPARSPAKNQYKDVTALGKRQRAASGASDAMGIVEAGREGELSDEALRKAVLRPSRKRAKTEQESGDELERIRTLQASIAGPSTTPAPAHPQVVQEPSESRDESLTNRAPVIRPRFDIFAGPEELSRVNDPLMVNGDDDIFTDRDFDFFDSAHLHAGDSGPGGPQTSTAHASENQPFTFTFPMSRLPMTSTPAGPASGSHTTPDSPVLSTFPYPEPPHSPSPAPVHRVDRGGGRLERVDIYRPFGAPPDSRQPSGSSTHDSGISPALLRTPPPTIPDLLEEQNTHGDRRKASSNDVGHGLGMTALPMRMGDTPAGPVRRTMYGTELEGDTRFGDFGVEGVASGYWAGGGRF